MLVHGATSDSLTVTSGVPQGSIFGPLLFLIYVNDLPSSVSSPSVDVSLFVERTKCFSIIQAPRDAHILNTEMNNVDKWVHSGRLKFNAQKCTVLSVTRKRNPIVAEYVINGRPLQHVSQQKDLGVTVSSDLTWSYHIHEQITKANLEC